MSAERWTGATRCIEGCDPCFPSEVDERCEFAAVCHQFGPQTALHCVPCLRGERDPREKCDVRLFADAERAARAGVR